MFDGIFRIRPLGDGTKEINWKRGVNLRKQYTIQAHDIALFNYYKSNATLNYASE